MTTVVRTFDELTQEQQPLAGGKGGSLARLYQAGYPVPDGFVILPDAFARDDLTGEAWSDVQNHVSRLREANPDIAFAVRSSARSEDSAEASFAGEFESVLNARTDDEIRRAIQTVYASRQNERVQTYSQVRGMNTAHEVAVVVQRLVDAESSGVMFTANPVSGQRDQIMISASWGLGEAIVGGLVTPDTLLVAKETPHLLQRETAEKRVMTVRLEHGTEEQPVPENMRHAAVLSDEEAVELAELGKRIEAFYGMPMDIEWVYASGAFAIVQARPITALPVPEPTGPVEWKLPKGMYAAMRNNIVELMADPLTPLFSTLGLAAINASMNRNLTAFAGRPGLFPEKLIINVNGYAYYNGSLTAGQMARIFLGSVGILKQMFTRPVERWTETGRPQYVAAVERWQSQPWQDRGSVEILAAARELTETAVDGYVALVAGVIPAAWISEGLFTAVYRLLKRKSDAEAFTYLLGFDSLPLRGEKSLFDLAGWARMQPQLAAYLSETPSTELAGQVAEDEAPAGVDAQQWQIWQSRFREHLRCYGHMIYNLDFANPVPVDDPAPILETLKLFLSEQGVNPYERQQAAADRREEVTKAMEARLKGLRLKLFRKRLAVAQRFAPLREGGLADVGLSYPLVRKMFRELGSRFVAGGLIEAPDDIFWLEKHEVEVAAARLDRGQDLDALSELVPLRRAKWRAAHRVAPPMMLPNKILGLDLEAMKAGRKDRDEQTIRGVAASPGRVTAPASVVHGPEDFVHMKTGDVLIAPLTTPAWTPLFARAAAVVTDIGGPLSHGSIVAREYGIPAVLGTGVATARIHTGQSVTVDGSTGTVTVA